jgi:hypothetical protein
MAESAITGHRWAEAVTALHVYSAAKMHAGRFAAADDDDIRYDLLAHQLEHAMTMHERAVYGVGR